MFYCKPKTIKAENYILITPAPIFPITLQEAKDYLKIIGADQDAEITQLISVATDIGEKITGRDFINKTYKAFLDCFPCDASPIQIRRTKLQSITSIQYLKDNVLTAFNSSEYYFTESNSYSEINLIENSSYPTDADNRKQAVEILFAAGYGSSASDVPEALKRAMLAHIAFLFSNAGDCMDNLEDHDEQHKKIYRCYILASNMFRVIS